MTLSKVLIATSLILGAALTVFVWMPFFALGGLIGATGSFLSDGFRWYGSLYADRDESYIRKLNQAEVELPSREFDTLNVARG